LKFREMYKRHIKMDSEVFIDLLKGVLNDPAGDHGCFRAFPCFRRRQSCGGGQNRHEADSCDMVILACHASNA
jgi:hypothetical protein